MSLKEKINSTFILRLHKRIRTELPPYVSQSIVKTIPVSFVLSVIEILSLSTLFPIINVIIYPEK
ncbi:MAG: hypothetical protein K0S12_831, partial [Bacteroidetes bacterium]|nr:hypothetical protein [Bacteroidota bacterium]